MSVKNEQIINFHFFLDQYTLIFSSCFFCVHKTLRNNALKLYLRSLCPARSTAADMFVNLQPMICLICAIPGCSFTSASLEASRAEIASCRQQQSATRARSSVSCRRESSWVLLEWARSCSPSRPEAGYPERAVKRMDTTQHPTCWPSRWSSLTIWSPVLTGIWLSSLRPYQKPLQAHQANEKRASRLGRQHLWERLEGSMTPQCESSLNGFLCLVPIAPTSLLLHRTQCMHVVHFHSDLTRTVADAAASSYCFWT